MEEDDDGVSLKYFNIQDNYPLTLLVIILQNGFMNNYIAIGAIA